jgi:hypothetical protein
MDGEPILKKTLMTVAAMISAWAAFVGTVTVTAVLVTSHVVGSASPGASDGANGSSPSDSASSKSDGPPGAHHTPNGRPHQSI